MHISPSIKEGISDRQTTWIHLQVLEGNVTDRQKTDTINISASIREGNLAGRHTQWMHFQVLEQEHLTDRHNKCICKY